METEAAAVAEAVETATAEVLPTVVNSRAAVVVVVVIEVVALSEAIVVALFGAIAVAPFEVIAAVALIAATVAASRMIVATSKVTVVEVVVADAEASHFQCTLDLPPTASSCKFCGLNYLTTYVALSTDFVLQRR
jgi:hypothetical protein